MMGFNLRFNELYRALRRLIRSGAFGQWVAARAVYSAPEAALSHYEAGVEHSERGEYEVTLVVTDDDGDDSEPVSDEIEVEGPAL